MSIDFSRNRTQERYESILGISTPEELKKNKGLFEGHSLSDSDVALLKPLLEQDALDFFNNAIISFSEGIDSIYSKRFSWATVKLYYSVFYLLRTSMACNNVALLRNRKMYRLRLKKGEKPYGTGNKKYNSTHSGTIAHYKDIFSGSDMLLTNKIDDIDAYQWMENARDIVNYRDISFRDPECLEIWTKYNESLDSGKLDILFNKIQCDISYSFCFQEEYAVVAIPIKRLQQTIMDMANIGLLKEFQLIRKGYIEKIIKCKDRNLHFLDDINGVNHNG